MADVDDDAANKTRMRVEEEQLVRAGLNASFARRFVANRRWNAELRAERRLCSAWIDWWREYVDMFHIVHGYDQANREQRNAYYLAPFDEARRIWLTQHHQADPYDTFDNVIEVQTRILDESAEAFIASIRSLPSGWSRVEYDSASGTLRRCGES